MTLRCAFAVQCFSAHKPFHSVLSHFHFVSFLFWSANNGFLFKFHCVSEASLAYRCACISLSACVQTPCNFMCVLCSIFVQILCDIVMHHYTLCSSALAVEWRLHGTVDYQVPNSIMIIQFVGARDTKQNNVCSAYELSFYLFYCSSCLLDKCDNWKRMKQKKHIRQTLIT